MDLFETLGLGPRQPEENEVYMVIYEDPIDAAVIDAVAAAAPKGGSGGGGRDAANENSLAGGPSPQDSGAAQSTAPYSGGAAACSNPAEGVADRLELLRARCTAWLLPYTTGYVWNKDPLVLRVSSRQAPPWERRLGPAAGRRRRAATFAAAAATGGGAPSAASQGSCGGDGHPPGIVGSSAGDRGREGCVWAVMRFGDAVDDEWWVVWLLLRMTRELQDLSVQVWDNDGQFLLIEAAYALPRWLKPETSDNRVWLRRGQLHIIPLPSTAAPDLPASPTVTQALAVLREGRFATASQRVQRPIDQRLEGYPARARREQQHVARCLLPDPVVAALRAEPQLVSGLVEAFYLRDADDMRAAARMRFLPASLKRSPVLVRMTRCHYAQLAAQRFSAPRGLAMPPPDSPLAKAADLGLKLTVAAEILCARHAPAVQQQQGNGEAEASSTGPLSEARFVADPSWLKFKASLEDNGYFQGNIPGSRRFKELLAAALEAYTTGLDAEGDGGSSSRVLGQSQSRSSGGGSGLAQLREPGRRLAEVVLGKAAEGGRANEATGNQACEVAEDDDSWLDQQPDRLQAVLDRRQAELNEHARLHSSGNKPSSDSPTPQGDSQSQSDQRHVREVDADDVAAKLRGFMEQLSGLEGVETQTDKAGPSSDVAGGGVNSGVDFNPARFLRELEKVLGTGGRTGRQAKQPRQGEMNNGTEEEEEGETSTEEGSSFFSSDDDDLDQTDDEGDEEEDQEEVEKDQTGLGSAGSHEELPTSWAHQPGHRTSAMATGGTDGLRPVQRSQPYESHRLVAQAPAPASRPGLVGNLQQAHGTVSTSTPENTSAAAGGEQSQLALKRGFLSRQGAPAAGVASRLGKGAMRRVRVMGPVCSGAGPALPVALYSAATGVVTSGAVGSSESDGNATVRDASRRQLDWEIQTATDSDDDEEDRDGGGWSDGTVSDGAARDLRGGKQRDSGDGQGDEDGDDHAATTRLLAALGVGMTISSSSEGDSSDGEWRRSSAAVRRGGGGTLEKPLRGTARQRRSRGGGTAPAMAAGVSSPGDGSGGGGGTVNACRHGGGGGGDVDVARGNDAFMPLYDSAMQAELAGTTLAHSFDVGPGIPVGGTGKPGVAARVSGTAGAPVAQDLRPVDLDMNLVRNLLRSYTAQQGSAGPAGNMAAMLGMPLVAGDVEN